MLQEAAGVIYDNEDLWLSRHRVCSASISMETTALLS